MLDLSPSLFIKVISISRKMADKDSTLITYYTN